jgi:endonuclease G
MKSIIIILCVLLGNLYIINSENIIDKKVVLRDSVYVKNNIFEVVYSEELEQPKWLKYKSTNRETKVNRAGMDFYTVNGIHTSDYKDYLNNIWDKGHLAPAATFSDNMENLKGTFSYLNCALQHADLNRGEWRLLEEQERKWDIKEDLTIKVELIFDKNSKRVPSNAMIPSYFVKHIYFEKSKIWKCYKFPNDRPTKGFKYYEIECKNNH